LIRPGKEDDVLKLRQWQLTGLALIWLTLLACGLPKGSPTSQNSVPVLPTARELSTESITYLTLPGGIPLTMPVVKCSGVEAGGYLDLRTLTGTANDPNHVEMLVSGLNNGAGTYDNMYVSINIGVNGKWSFSGSTLVAQVKLDDSGSGSFTGVLITNTGGSSDKYPAGKAYPFSAEWVCK
jgi:hypothetical protein